MLSDPPHSPYDLKWRMLDTRIRVHWLFWLVTAVLGWRALDQGLAYLLVWVGCVFVSILVHEFGHVLAGRTFGSDGHIVLYGMGGLAIGSSNLSNRWQRIAVYLAGPAAGFLLIGAMAVVLYVLAPETFAVHRLRTSFAFGIRPQFDFAGMDHEAILRRLTASSLFDSAIADMIWINLLWGLFNLLPIWPLDGGQTSRDLLDWAYPRGGIRLSLQISVLFAGLLAVNSLMATNGKPLIPFLNLSGWFTTLFFAMMAFESFQLMQRTPAGREPYEREEEERWDTGSQYRDRESDPDWWRK